jgi:hypothetical protein
VNRHWRTQAGFFGKTPGLSQKIWSPTSTCRDEQQVLNTCNHKSSRPLPQAGRGRPGPRPRPRPRFVRGRGRGVRPRFARGRVPTLPRPRPRFVRGRGRGVRPRFARGRGRSPVPVPDLTGIGDSPPSPSPIWRGRGRSPVPDSHRGVRALALKPRTRTRVPR